MGFRRRLNHEPKIELTPMIDVVFLLLIFFMMTTSFIERPGLDISLPSSAADEIHQGQKEVRVYLTKTGEIYLQRQLVGMDDLLTRLADYGPARTRGMTFLLMADKEALHGQVVALMDAAKLAGFGQLAIATDKTGKN